LPCGSAATHAHGSTTQNGSYNRLPATNGSEYYADCTTYFLGLPVLSPVGRENIFSETSDEIAEAQFPYFSQKVSAATVIQQLPKSQPQISS
jgi:hypothetical protein